MKIAILDFTMPKTHRRFNLCNFEVLSQISDLYIVNSAHYYDSLDSQKNVYLMDTDIAEYSKKHMVENRGMLSSIVGRMVIIHNIRENLKLFKKFKDVRFDYILIMGYEVMTFAVFRFCLPKNIPIYIFQHQQINELENRIKNFLFSTYKNKVHHIVLEEIFRDYLVQKIKVKYVYVVHHFNGEREAPIPRYSNKFILGISSTNDEGWIKKMIEEEEKKGFLINSKLKMRLRSHIYTFKDSNLVVDNQYFSDAEYDKYFERAAAVVSLPSETFYNRLSGQVLDAILAGKIVISLATPLIREYKKMAPTLFVIFENIKELQEYIKKQDWVIHQDDLRYMKYRHSKNAAYENYRRIFCKSRRRTGDKGEKCEN